MAPDVEEFFDSISSPEPEAFLQALIDNSRERAESLQEAVAGNANSDLEDRVNDFADQLTAHAEEVTGSLEEKSFGEYAYHR